MRKKGILSQAYKLAGEACKALTELLEKTGKITLNPKERAADMDEDTEDEECEPTIWLTIYDEDNESHEHVLLSIGTRYSETLGAQVFDCQTYDMVTWKVVTLNPYDLPTTSATLMCGLYDDLYDIAARRGLIDEGE